MGSRGSVIFVSEINKMKSKTIPITDEEMTRFMITSEDGAKFVWNY